MQLIKPVLVAVALTASIVTFAPSPAVAAKDPVYTGYLTNVAVEGHDAVAYFTEGRPVEGKREFTTEYNGAEWRFSSAENLAKFEAEPAKYAPQYGGYCAYAVSKGYTAKGDADHWRIVDGKLYLNFSASVQRTWEQDIPGNIRNANARWPNVLN